MTPSSESSAALRWLVPLCLLALCSDLHVFHARAFEFTYTPPTQCDSLNVSWTGGRAPFYLLITPLFAPSQNISIPASGSNAATNDSFFSTQLILPAGQRFLLSMSDASGFASGGISNVLTVGSSVSNVQCNTTEPNSEFLFQTPSSLQQCSNFVFDGYDGAVQPVAIMGLIPLGQPFSLFPPNGSTSFTWQTNVAAGTSMVFIMTDSRGRSGGSSDLVTIAASDNSSCVNANSPHSTASPSETSAPHETQTVQVGSSGVRAGEIAGIVLGAVAFLALVGLISACLVCRRRRHRKGVNDDEDDEDDSRPPIVQVGSGGAFVGNRGTSRLSRVRTSMMPTSRRPTQRHVDLLPPSSTHRSSNPQHSPLPSPTFPPLSQYEANPYTYPSEVSALDGHSSSTPSTDVYAQVSHASPLSRSRGHSSDEGHAQIPFTPTSRSRSHSRHPSLPPSTNTDPASPKSMSVRYSTPRFILHTDAEDPNALPENEELVELPPQYTDRRHPSPVHYGDTKRVPPSG